MPTAPHDPSALLQVLRRRPEQRCEVCGAAIDDEHWHVANVPTRSVLCICRPCFLLFERDGAGGKRFRAVPDRYVVVAEGPELHQGPWQALGIPIHLSFLFSNSDTGKLTAFCPGPAGATESELALDAWTDVVRAHPVLARLAPDVEALLVRQESARPGPVPPRPDPEGIAVIVPIDFCYELVGSVRRLWQGVCGGDAAWREVDAAIAYALERARPEVGA